jgi:4-hydroxybenzoate polyprenyltransferase
MLYFPPFLGGTLLLPGTLGKGMIPFAAFCLASSATYVLNDILDKAQDSLHPLKKMRPIPAGDLSVRTAAVYSSLLAALSFIFSLRVSTTFTIHLAIYFLVSCLYSFKFKDIPIVDIFSISSGFVVRLLAGGVAFGVVISEWLFLTVFLLAMFLSTGKRLGEKIILGEEAGSHRRCLESYPRGFLEGTMFLTGASVLVTYTMYALPHKPLVYSVPLCAYGLLRYILRVKSGAGGDPTESLVSDLQLLAVGVFWVVLVGWSIYW